MSNTMQTEAYESGFAFWVMESDAASDERIAQGADELGIAYDEPAFLVYEAAWRAGEDAARKAGN